MALWSAWYPDILPHVPGCPTLIIDHELRRAAQKFFQRTRAWKTSLAAVAVLADQQTVTLAPTDTLLDLVRLEAAWYDGTEMGIKTVEEMDAEFSDDWETHTGTPSIAIQQTPGVLRLYPIPVVAATTGIKRRISVCPSDTATGVADEMRVAFRDVLTAGAKAKLFLYLDKSWANPELAVVANNEFEDGINKANLAAARAFGRCRVPSRSTWC